MTNTSTIQDFDDQSLGYQDSGERTPCLSRDALEDDQGGQDAASEGWQADLAYGSGCGGSLGGCSDTERSDKPICSEGKAKETEGGRLNREAVREYKPKSEYQ